MMGEYYMTCKASNGGESQEDFKLGDCWYRYRRREDQSAQLTRQRKGVIDYDLQICAVWLNHFG